MSISIHELTELPKQPESDKSPCNDDKQHTDTTAISKQDKKRMRFWQTVVITTCFITYGFNYFTRNHVYITTNKFKAYLDPNNDKNAQKWLGIMYSAGQGGFFISKLICSFLIDTKINSGVKPFAFGLIGVPVCTTIIALFIIKDFTIRILFVLLMWTLAKSFQAPMWSGVVKIISDWIDYQYYGRVVSFMSLSYLAGDAVTRGIFSYVLTFDKMNGWREIFYFASIMTIIAVIPLLIFVKDSPTKRGLHAPEANPDNVYHQANIKTGSLTPTKEANNYNSILIKSDEEPTDNDITNELKAATKSHSKLSQSKSWILLQPLLSQMMFYFIMLFNLYLSILRTFFQMYTADYLETVVGTSDSIAALISSFFPAMGVLSAPLNGIWIDIMLNKNRKFLRYILFPIQGFAFTIALIILYFDQHPSLSIASLLILICGFGILGCYAMLYVLSLDLGGGKSPTIVSGITDCVGLIGSMSMSFLSGFVGYQFLFAFLSIVGIAFIITSICLVWYSYCKS